MDDKKPYGIVYEALCVPTGKRYIGLTTKDLKKRWRQHCYDASLGPQCNGLFAAISGYGADAFVVRPVMSALSQSDLYACEAMMIAQEGTMKPNGLNHLPGNVEHLDKEKGEARLRIQRAYWDAEEERQREFFESVYRRPFKPKKRHAA